MNINRTTIQAPKPQAAQQKDVENTTIELTVPSTQNMLEQTESFVTGRGGSTLLHGLSGLIPGVGGLSAVNAGMALSKSDAKRNTPSVAFGLEVATLVGAASSVFAAGSILDSFMTPNRAMFGPWTVGAIAVAGGTSALAAYVAGTEFN